MRPRLRRGCWSRGIWLHRSWTGLSTAAPACGISLFWSPAAKVAEQLGATQAHCFEVVNFCNAGATGIAIATGWVNANPEKTALVIICDRLSGLIDHADSASRALFNFGDSATALLVGIECPLLTLSACDMQTDPTWCDMYQGGVSPGAGACA
ncbi:hypothetical protein JNO11_12070 [Pantoea sp. 1B4]|nr:hypothetical protein [Pantoea sp. 1B4]